MSNNGLLVKWAIWIAEASLDLESLLFNEPMTLENEEVKKEYQGLTAIMTCILCMKRYTTSVWNNVPKDVINLIIGQVVKDMEDIASRSNPQYQMTVAQILAQI